METEYNYTCPNCSKDCTVPESMVGQNLTCPNCSGEFFATLPEGQPQVDGGKQHSFTLPEKLPFLKSGRRAMLVERFEKIMATGSLDAASRDALCILAIQLGFGEEEVARIRDEHFVKEFGPIQQRIESSFVLTDDDLEVIARLEAKYGVKARLEGTASLFRAIYLLESNGTLPQPLSTTLMLEGDEIVYFSMPTTWYQSRVHGRGYSGVGVSIPSGIKGVRFRFGGYTPRRTEEITALASGLLYVTTRRLLFKGEARNTSIALKKIVDGHVFSDSVKIEKSTGKPDFFAMDAGHARYVLSLVGVLR
jgi:DNA-directed RNA polymerase subunit RPC12/RpoP